MFSCETKRGKTSQRVWVYFQNESRRGSNYIQQTDTNLHGTYRPWRTPIPFSKTVPSILGNSFVFLSFFVDPWLTKVSDLPLVKFRTWFLRILTTMSTIFQPVMDLLWPPNGLNDSLEITIDIIVPFNESCVLVCDQLFKPSGKGVSLGHRGQLPLVTSLVRSRMTTGVV
jgi:hypothetical protein